MVAADKPDVIVLGAGMAGLVAASGLQAAGLKVVVLEKARGPGGRMSTRRAEPWAFDHGAQYFTARSREFSAAVADWHQSGLVARWNPRLTVFGKRPDQPGSSPGDRWVGIPGMNGMLSSMAQALDCRFNARVSGLVPEDAGWTVTSDSGEPLSCAHLVLTAPPYQCVDLLGTGHPLAEQLLSVNMHPCLALMLGFESSLKCDFDAAFVNTGPLSWIARDSAKPGRLPDSSGEAWVAHAGSAWSAEHLDQDPQFLVEPMMAAFSQLLDGRIPKPVFKTVHRWRYAQADPGMSVGCLADPSSRLVIAGDWCAGNRVEGAWLSGRQAVANITG